MKRAFSLMEMLVVLLIVSVVLAVSAPMLNKKFSKQSATTSSSWIRTGINGSIAFNIKNKENVTVSIGTAFPITDKKPALFISAPETYPHIAFGISNKVQGLISILNKNYWLTNSVPNNVVASTSIGHDSLAGNNAIAIGNKANAKGFKSIALGDNSSAQYKNSIAIGNNVTTNKNNQIVIGNSEQSVHIKGDLIIEKGITLDALGINLNSNSASNDDINSLKARIELLENINKELIEINHNFEARLRRLER